MTAEEQLCVALENYCHAAYCPMVLEQAISLEIVVSVKVAGFSVRSEWWRVVGLVQQLALCSLVSL